MPKKSLKVWLAWLSELPEFVSVRCFEKIKNISQMVVCLNGDESHGIESI